MSELKVHVVEIDTIETHPNADRLDIATMKQNDWVCVVGRNQFKPGDRCIYIPIDAVLTPDLEESIGIKLKNGRIRSMRLRGIFSQGLIIEAEPYHNVGDDVAKELEITKYTPPAKTQRLPGSPKKGGKSQLSYTNNNFNRYTDIDHLKNYKNIIKENDQVIITEKLHGCLQYSTNITLANGEKIPIGKIVSDKLDVELLGLNREGEITTTKITNWFDNGKTKEWKKVTFTRKGLNKNRGNYYGSILCTPNHKFFNPSKNIYISCSELLKGDKILIEANFREIRPKVIEQEILDIEDYEYVNKIHLTKYDIETETHNFFANGVLVHNSSWRCGKPEITNAQKRRLNKWYRRFWRWIKKLPTPTHEFLVGSRKVIKKENAPGYYDTDVWFQTARKYKMEEKLRGNQWNGYVFYGEIIGKGIQELEYGHEDHRLYIYDVAKDGKYLSTSEARGLCFALNLNYVPVLYHGPWHDGLKDLANGKSYLCKDQIREGIVVRTVEETYHHFCGRVILKIIGEEYALSKGYNQSSDDV